MDNPHWVPGGAACADSKWSNLSGDPTHEHTDGTWWFYDEAWTDEFGPFSDKETCDEQLDVYCRSIY